MPNFINLHGHSHYSLLDGLCSVNKVVKRAADINMSAVALTDHGNLSGIMKLEVAAKDAGIKNINGIELYLTEPEVAGTTHLVTWAKNLKGWRQLLKIVQLSNRRENFYRHPRLSRSQFAEFCDGNIMCTNGHPGSSLANCLFPDFKAAFNARSIVEAKSLLYPDCLDRAVRLAEEYQFMLGKGNFWIEIQNFDHHFKAGFVIAEVLREVSMRTGIPKLATADSHYAKIEDAIDQRVLLCAFAGSNLYGIQTKIDNDEDFGLSGFFRSDRYYIPTQEEMIETHKGHEDEIANTQLVADMVESYTVKNKPKLPIFDCPGGISPEEYLKQICRDGWKEKIVGKIPKDQTKTYGDRIRHELDTLLPLGLASYFLIVRDYIDFAKNSDSLVGRGRGSSAGCLLSYLSGVTGHDPIPPGLQFSRFYNAGRNSGDHITMPDIDTDFEQSFRQSVIEYVMNKYSHDNVAPIVTFSAYQGRGALKVVLKAHNVCTPGEQEKITKAIPDPARVSDDLQEMIKQGREGSIILWALENTPKELEEWATLKDDGSITGPYAEYFKQAIRIEGCKQSASKHASGYIISGTPLVDYVPLIRDKSSENLLVAWEGPEAEKAGAPKFDILGLKNLDVLHETINLVGRGVWNESLPAFNL